MHNTQHRGRHGNDQELQQQGTSKNYISSFGFVVFLPCQIGNGEPVKTFCLFLSFTVFAGLLIHKSQKIKKSRSSEQFSVPLLLRKMLGVGVAINLLYLMKARIQHRNSLFSKFTVNIEKNTIQKQSIK
jgi:hypothetical protein